MKKAISYSLNDNSYNAGQTVMKDLLFKLDGNMPNFLMMFTTVGHNIPKIIEGIYSVAGEIPLCGCTGTGTITSQGSDETMYSLGLMGICSDRVNFTPFMFSGLSSDPGAVGKKIGEKINSIEIKETDQRLLFIFPDGMTINSNALFDGIEQELPYPITILGGTAGNDYSSTKTYQFCNSDVAHDAVSGVIITGDYKYKAVYSHGAEAIGNERIITKSCSNLLFEIDKQPAANFLRKFLDDLSDIGATLNLFGFGQIIDGPNNSNDMVIITVLGIDDETGALRLGAEISEGSRIRLTRRSIERVKQETQNMARNLRESLVNPDSATYFYFNCAGRATALYGDSDQDVDNLIEILGKQDLFGFFTFGEIVPSQGLNRFHNHTGVLVAIE